jgi:hypothetical protein
MLIRLISLLFLTSCATKYIVPGNRFMTPETEGGAFRTGIEIYQSTSYQLTADITKGSVDEGVITNVTNRSGFAIETSFLEQIDLFWTHTGGGNSLLGVKYQFLGASKNAKSAGHKMAIAAAMGGNEHETDGKNKVEFSLTGQEFQFLYGYRLNEFILAYSNFAYARYNFDGEIHSSDSMINGLKPVYVTKVYSLYGGLEFGLGDFFLKGEYGYQALSTTDTKAQSNYIFGYAVGMTF